MMKWIGMILLLLLLVCLSAQNARTGKGKVVPMDTTRVVSLDEVVITAPLKEVELRGDTTVINASAFKTAEGAYLEELVRRIPRLEYDRQNKTITYNGLTINEINVDRLPPTHATTPSPSTPMPNCPSVCKPRATPPIHSATAQASAATTMTSGCET